MADFPFATAQGGARVGDMSVDVGLRKFMLGVYQKLTIGILVAGALAYLAGTWAPLTELIFGNQIVFMAVMWGPPVLLLGSMFLMKNPSPLGTAVLYWAVVGLIGLSMGIYVLMAQTGISGTSRGGITQTMSYVTIAKAFLITASSFAALSLFGYTTKRDLSGIGSFAVMAIWGVLALSLVNIFLPANSMIEWIIMGAVLLLSAVLVAVNTQQLKTSYYELGGDTRSMMVLTNYGALNFFISFVNMFRIILTILSSRD